jgi:hypothetical protein
MEARTVERRALRRVVTRGESALIRLGNALVGMASLPPVECPICHAATENFDGLHAHLLADHDKDELARSILTRVEQIEDGTLG